MDDDVARLVREERLLEAAELASTRGDARSASALFERACDFKRAAEQAVAAHDWARALPLALEGKAEAIAELVFPKLVADGGLAERVAFHLERRGDHGWAARLLESIGKRTEAARAYERGGDAIKASELLEAAGDVIGASKVLEAQVRREPQRGALLVALGSLLHRYGKTDAAVRMLQRVAAGAPERRAALTILIGALERLGFAQARVEAETELHALGGPVQATSEPRGAPVRARLFGRYEVVRDVASSPHARVIECVDGVRNERVAVKIFAGYDARGAGRDALARFEREVRVLGTLDHPNIVPLRDYLPEGPALVLGWMSRGTLEQMLASEAITPARAVEIAQAVLSALGEAHRLGIIHRDIKPANVLFDDAGVTRLGDFGVAHLSDLSATATAGVIGTLGYMSPEQREGRPATVRSDIFGVGALLWEMLTGERPEPAPPAPSLRPGSLSSTSGDLDEPPPSSGLSVEGRVRPSGVHRERDARHDALVFSLLDLDPQRRPADSFEARKALGALRWPNTIDRVAIPRPERQQVSERPSGARLQPDESGPSIDQWLGRHVVSVPLEPVTLARASAFARADHPALQVVLRVDRESRTIWLAVPRGAPLATRPSAEQLAVLRDALDRLHELGQVHGAVDTSHVLVDESGAVTLAFAPPPGPTATFDLDRLALARLGESGA
ncbi:MAG: Serine/threonine protein kinase PrkC, regulator of stationary phase [Labilithrix sp.]|nr:Serine/threonine protein kinase PrkC, regulator of stationary phase [Labilithrix sp.]